MNTIVIELAEENKQNLFGSAIHRLQSRRSEAEDVLDNMQRLNPGIAQSFTLKETAVSDFPIRMLVPSVSPLELELGRPVQNHLVVSYCWHHDSWTLANQGTSFKPWPFGEAMARATLDMRISEDEGIWLDQCCINQSDEQEKEIAVSSTDIICSCARKKLMLLEDIKLWK